MADTYDSSGQRITPAPTFIPATGDGTQIVRDNSGNIISQPTSKTPSPSSQIKSTMQSSSLTGMNTANDTAQTDAQNNLNPQPTPAPPTPLPTGYALGNVDPTTGATTVTGPNGKPVLTVPQGGDYNAATQKLAKVQDSVTRQFGADHNISTDASGNYLVVAPDGKTVSLASTIADDPGSLSSAMGSLNTYYDDYRPEQNVYCYHQD